MMKCGNCFLEFAFEEFEKKEIGYYNDDEVHVVIWNYECPYCNGPNIRYVAFKHEDGGGKILPIWPPTDRPSCPPEVPSYIAEDYQEACLVLPISPKASAALSRRCLQNLLRDVAKVKQSDLSKEIQEVIDSGKLPSLLTDSIDAIRNIGNFAAHPTKSKSTGEIVEVEPKEVEWNLDVLESLFDFYYVQPIKVAKKREALNAKLNEVGKPPMK